MQDIKCKLNPRIGSISTEESCTDCKHQHFCFECKYFGVTLDRTFTNRPDLDSLRKNWNQASHPWGGLLPRAGATTLRTATLALVHLTAEYCQCAPAWCCSVHTSIIDFAINNALWTAIGCLRPTLADNLSILAGIQPAELRHRGATLSLARPEMESGHLLHWTLTRPPVAMHDISNWVTHLCSPHNNSFHLTTTTEVRRYGRITDGMRNGWMAL